MCTGNKGYVISFGQKLKGVDRFPEWGALEAMGATEWAVVFLDNRVLEMLKMEIGSYLVSCRFRCCEDNFTKVFF